VPSRPLVSSSSSKSRLRLRSASTLALSLHSVYQHRHVDCAAVHEGLVLLIHSVWRWIMTCDRRHWSRMWLVSNNRHLNVTYLLVSTCNFSLNINFGFCLFSLSDSAFQIRTSCAMRAQLRSWSQVLVRIPTHFQHSPVPFTLSKGWAGPGPTHFCWPLTLALLGRAKPSWPWPRANRVGSGPTLALGNTIF